MIWVFRSQSSVKISLFLCIYVYILGIKMNMDTDQRAAMNIQNDEQIRVILIISNTYMHSYLF